MKRRSFLEGIKLTAVGLPILSSAQVGAGSRILGLPNSIAGPEAEGFVLDHNRLHLSLARANVPVDAWNKVCGYADLWMSVLADRSQAAEFSRDPGKYLRKKGVPESVLSSRDMEMKVMMALLDPEISRMSMSGDYFGFLSRLRDAGSLTAVNYSGLKSKLVEILERDRIQIEEELRSQGIMNDEALSKLLGEDNFRALVEMIRSGRVVVPNLFAVLIVAVLVVAAVGVALVVAVTVLVSVTVKVSGAPRDPQDPQDPIAPDKVASQEPLAALNPRIAMMEPALLENMEVKMRVAQMLGNESFSQQAYRDVLRAEVCALVDAAEQVGIVQIDAAARSEFDERVESIVFSMAGI